MEKEKFSYPVSLRRMQITDKFWKNEMELVRTEVIPYQWNALNDKVEGAAPSYCMHNFKVAAEMNRQKRKQGAAYKEPSYTYRGFEMLPEDPENLKDEFYGYVFQDTDFSKWVEAVGYSLTQHPDPDLEKVADAAIDIVCAAQQEDGYLDTYYIINGKDGIFTNLRDHHELYCMGHLIEGAVAYYEATGKDKLLHAAERFADYATDYFGPEEGKCKGYPGHEIAEMALVRLYEVTGEQKYLDLSRFFIDERGTKPYYFDKEHPEAVKKGHENELRNSYYQAHLPVRQQDEAFGHAVRAVYLYSGMADIARITKDEELYQACVRLWNNVTKKKMYITGGIGATHLGEAFSFPYDLPNDTAYAETCASIGLMFWARRMLEIVPDAKYADIMERALYNGVLSGMALDGKSFFYVNPLEVLPEACHKDERKFHVKPVRQKWFGCACCPPNLARLISSIGSYAFTENEDTLFVHLYMGSNVEKTVNGKTVNVQMESDMPWEGNIKIRVQAENAKMTLALRIPGWCKNYKISGIEDAAQEEKDGYLYLKKVWNREENFCIDFPMEVQMFAASERVREDIGKAAIMRGPVVYCLEEKDNGKNLHELLVDTDIHASVSEGKICDTVVKMVETDGWRLTESGDEEETLYHMYQKPQKQKVRLHYIPYYTWANRGENEMQVWTRVQNP